LRSLRQLFSVACFGAGLRLAARWQE